MTEYTIKRAKDFNESGEYDLTIDNITVQIYRDVFQFSYPIWYCVQYSNILEYSKKDIIEKLIKSICI
jgi:hypothetical protein